MLSGKKTKVEFIESYIKLGAGDYQWNDNHGELVRCKDCVYFDDNAITVHGADTGECKQGVQRFVPEDWFCADGERKDDTD